MTELVLLSVCIVLAVVCVLLARRGDDASAHLRATLEPLTDHLRRVETEVAQLDRDRRRHDGELTGLMRAMGESVERLRGETGQLVGALKRPAVRGAWGELQLRNCVRAAGLTEHVDFHTQQTITTADGSRLRPDMVVHLPAGGEVIVDSKVPLEAYLAALEQTDEDRRDGFLDRHARQLRAHVDALAAKAYHAELLDSAELTVCFVPNEAIFCAALDRDPTLLEHGATRGVVLATPATLIALLYAVSHGWRHEALAADARAIAADARELHKRCATFLAAFAKLGGRLGSAVRAYDEAAASLEARLLPQLRRFEELGATSGRTLEEPPRLDPPVRA